MLVLAALAVSVRGDLDDVGPFFALTYAAGRVLLVLIMVAHGRATGQLSDGDRTLVRGFSLGAVLWVASAALSGPLQPALWGLALLVDVLSVLWAERSQDRDLPHQSHFPERVGLLFIVFLGAVVTELIRGAAEQRLQFADQLPAALAFLTIMAVWRLYFDEAHTLPAVLAGRSGESGNLLAWSYTHLPLTLALSVLSIGLGLGIAEEGREADRHERLLVSGTLAVIFLCLAALRALSARPLGLQAGGLRVSGGSRLGAAALVLLLIPAPLGTTAYEALCAVITLAVAYLGWQDPARSQLSKIEDVLNEEAGPAGQQRG